MDPLFQVLGESLHITSEYLTHEAKIASTVSKVEALEAENSTLKKDLIYVMDKANTIQGFMHACYSLGALFAPLIATSMVITAAWPWYTYYYVMVSANGLTRYVPPKLTFGP